VESRFLWFFRQGFRTLNLLALKVKLKAQVQQVLGRLRKEPVGQLRLSFQDRLVAQESLGHLA